jgi:hypothetical protein
MRKTFTFGILVGLVAVLVACGFLDRAAGQQPGAPAPGVPKGEFKGKILAVSVKSVAGSNTVILEQARIQRLAELPFLVGKVLDQPEVKGPRGRTTWLALYDVIRIVEFDDVEQLKEAYANQEQR